MTKHQRVIAEVQRRNSHVYRSLAWTGGTVAVVAGGGLAAFCSYAGGFMHAAGQTKSAERRAYALMFGLTPVIVIASAYGSWRTGRNAWNHFTMAREANANVRRIMCDD